jgi:hypothetical protein
MKVRAEVYACASHERFKRVVVDEGINDQIRVFLEAVARKAGVSR